MTAPHRGMRDDPEAGGLTYGYDFWPDQKRHVWHVVGPAGGIHIWARMHDAEFAARFGDVMYGGVECHWRAYQGEYYGHNEKCWLLGGRCWHDGSSLYFSERIEPILRYMDLGGKQAAAFVNAELEDWYRSRFATPPEGAAS